LCYVEVLLSVEKSEKYGEVYVNEKKELVSLFAPLSRLYTTVNLHMWNALLSTSSLNKKGKTKIKTRSATRGNKERRKSDRKVGNESCCQQEFRGMSIHGINY
jgi:hypothetical protein